MRLGIYKSINTELTIVLSCAVTHSFNRVKYVFSINDIKLYVTQKYLKRCVRKHTVYANSNHTKSI